MYTAYLEVLYTRLGLGLGLGLGVGIRVRVSRVYSLCRIMCTTVVYKAYAIIYTTALYIQQPINAEV